MISVIGCWRRSHVGDVEHKKRAVGLTEEVAWYPSISQFCQELKATCQELSGKVKPE